MPLSPAAAGAVQAFVEACAKRSSGSPAPAVPEAVLAFPRGERADMIAHLIREHRAGTFHGRTYFGAESAWSALLGSISPIQHDELCKVLHAIGDTRSYLCGYPWRYAWEQAQRIITVSGITPALHDALRAMAGSMRVHQSDKNAAIAIDRALFFERFSALDPSCSAADVVRRDLRAMPAAPAASWEKLLAHGMAGTHAEPKATWQAKADRQARKIGDLDDRVGAWLGEIAALPDLQVSTAGADALRGLLWVSALRARAPGDAIVALAGKAYKRGQGWSPRHDRFVGALAWAVGVLRPAGAEALLLRMQKRFGKTTAKYAIDGALEKVGSRAEGESQG